MFFLICSTSQTFAEGFRIQGSLYYYSVGDSIYKDTYGKGTFMLGGSLSYKVVQKFELRAEANYFQDKGEMTFTKEDITFSVLPIVLGLRIQFMKIKKLSPYFGAGIDIYFYKENLPDRYEDVSDSTTGFHVEVGTYITVTKRFYFDVNVRFIKADAKPFDEKIKLGGIRAGIGIGLSF
jgi:opacity protein-like surface antigen